MQPYLTVTDRSSAEYTDRRSRFIAVVAPVSSEQEALAVIREISKEHWDARHNVYAYIIREGNISRFSDDGEPQGTAGMPVLEVLRGSGIVDCVVVVTRYFGGVLLGTGGLVRAYSSAAKGAVENATIVNMEPSAECRLQCDYNRYGMISSVLAESECADINAEFSDAVDLRFTVRMCDFAQLDKKLTDLTAGSVKIEKIIEKYHPFLKK